MKPQCIKRWLLTLQHMKQPSKKLELLCVFHSLMTLMCCAMEELALYIVQESRCGKCKFVCKALRSCSLVIHCKNGATVDGGRKERMNEQSARVGSVLPPLLRCCYYGLTTSWSYTLQFSAWPCFLKCLSPPSFTLTINRLQHRVSSKQVMA